MKQEQAQKIPRWRQVLCMLRRAPASPALEPSRLATIADVDHLAEHVPQLASWGRRDRLALAAEMSVRELPAGAAIVRAGEPGDSAFFILEGGAVAGCQERHGYHVLEVLRAGDFFGEIAALMGVPRTADVLAEQASTVLEVPASVLRRIIDDARLSQYLLSRMPERLMRTSPLDRPSPTIMFQQVAIDDGAPLG